MNNFKIFPRTRIRIFYDSLRYFFENLFSFGFINKYAARRLIQYYGGNNGHWIDVKKGNLGYGFIHYAFIRNLKPKRVLCIGSGYGFIPAICALACKDNQFGKVDFIDASYDKTHSKNWGGTGFWKQIKPERYFALLGVNGWLKTYLMTSEEFAIKNKSKNKKDRYGYIYLDGDHSYEGAKKDFDLFWPELAKGGLMVFHDVVVKNWGDLKNFGVWRFWRELKKESKIIFPFPKESGLGIIQKNK